MRKHKNPHLLNPPGIIIQKKNYGSSYPSELIYLLHFNMIYPVLQQSSSNIVRRPQNLNQSSTSFLHYLVTSKQSRRLIQIFVGFSEKKNLKKAALLSAVGLNFWATGQPSRNRPQNFLINLGIKLIMHLLKKSIFSLNNDIVRLTKIMTNIVKGLKILIVKINWSNLAYFSSKNI